MLMICRKTVDLNKEISCYENVKLGPKESRTIVGTTKSKEGRGNIRDKIPDPRIKIRKNTKVKNGKCNINIYNISNQEIKIPQETIIAGIKENKYPKLEISMKGNKQKWNKFTVEVDEDFSLKDISVNGNINKEMISKLVHYLISDREIFKEKLRVGDIYKGQPAKVTVKKGVNPKQAKIYPRSPRDHEIIDQMMKEFLHTGIVKKCEKDSD